MSAGRVYADRMDPVKILLGASLIIPLLALVGLVRIAWRVWYGNEEMQPGGSYGRQITRRD